MKFTIKLEIDVDTDEPVKPSWQRRLGEAVHHQIVKVLEIGEPRIDDEARFAFVAMRSSVE